MRGSLTVFSCSGGQQTPLQAAWAVPLYVTAGVLARRRSPFDCEVLEIEFDFISHRLVARTSRGEEPTFSLERQAVADFRTRLLDLLKGVGVDFTINDMPNEVPNPIRFSQDYIHVAYDALLPSASGRAHAGRSHLQALPQRLPS